MNTKPAELSAEMGSFHPECAEDEVFVCYETEEGFPTIGYESKRMGAVSIRYGGDEFFPVFAKKSECSP